CEGSTLVTSDGFFEPNYTLDGNSWNVIGVVNGAEGVGYFQVDEPTDLDPTDRIRVTGNAIGDQDMEVLFVERSYSGSTGIFGTAASAILTTRVYPVGGLSGADAAGTIQAYSSDESDGINLAHAFDEMLFGGYPYGAAARPEHFDADSLEALGALMETEGVSGSLIALNGETIRTVLGAALQDITTILPFDTALGKHVFTPIREPAA